MITTKELEYVEVWARKAPYPGERYAVETLENMKLLLEKYKKDYKGKDYNIIFSDSSEINFEILDSNVCHMLGVDFKNLIGGGYRDFIVEVLGLNPDEKITSYNLVTSLLDNYEEVMKYDESTDFRVINYYKCRIKCAIFEKIGELEKFNFGKLDVSDNSKVLFSSSNEAVSPYFLIRLAKDEIKLKYCVSSLLAPRESELNGYFNYKCSIPTQMIIDDNKNLSKIEATPKEKINLLNLYKSILLNYSVNNQLDISGDYLATLALLDNNEKRKILI